jgi:hypothetical protein
MCIRTEVLWSCFHMLRLVESSWTLTIKVDQCVNDYNCCIHVLSCLVGDTTYAQKAPS